MVSECNGLHQLLFPIICTAGVSKLWVQDPSVACDRADSAVCIKQAAGGGGGCKSTAAITITITAWHL